MIQNNKYILGFKNKKTGEFINMTEKYFTKFVSHNNLEYSIRFRCPDQDLDVQIKI